MYKNQCLNISISQGDNTVLPEAKGAVTEMLIMVYFMSTEIGADVLTSSLSKIIHKMKGL